MTPNLPSEASAVNFAVNKQTRPDALYDFLLGHTPIHLGDVAFLPYPAWEPCLIGFPWVAL